MFFIIVIIHPVLTEYKEMPSIPFGNFPSKVMLFFPRFSTSIFKWPQCPVFHSPLLPKRLFQITKSRGSKLCNKTSMLK